MSIRDLIANASDLDRETVEVPEWGVTLELRTPTGQERADLMAKTVDTEGKATDWSLIYPSLLVCCAHDPETGERAFTYADIMMLNSKSAAVLQRLGLVCLRIAGMDQQAVDAGKGGS